MGIFEIFPILFIMMFLLVFGVILTRIIKDIGQQNKNNHSPRLTVQATVVGKRDEQAYYPSGRTHGGTHRTQYFATFQVESGDRMELQLQGFEYGMLVEGDTGKLSFQGTRYLGFERM